MVLLVDKTMKKQFTRCCLLLSAKNFVVTPQCGAINDFASIKSANLQLAEVKQRLQGFDYIFMDEVSMLSCKNIYRISKRLAKVMNNTEKPFGGLNMIFAGDFRQLPPEIRQEHALLYTEPSGSRSHHWQGPLASNHHCFHPV